MKNVFCEECVNFPSPESKRWGDCAKRIYLCDKETRMNFILPTSPIDDEWGFQKEMCASYLKKESKPVVYGIIGLVPRRNQK